MPLWTIFVKWPVPAPPTWANPPSGASASKTGWADGHVGLGPADHEAVAVVLAPHATARAGVDVADALRRDRGGPADGCPPSWSCRPRRSRRPARAARRARRPSSSVGSPGRHHHPHHPRRAAAPRPARRATARRVAGLNASKPTTSWPWARSRSAMLPPIFPRPTMPSFTRCSLQQLGEVDPPGDAAPVRSAPSGHRRPGRRAARRSQRVGTARDRDVRPRRRRAPGRTRCSTARPCGAGRWSAGTGARSRA